MTLDPVALEVLRHALEGVADEMGAVLRRTAASPNIKERMDCSAAVFGPSGELAAQAEHIPVHLGSMPASVAAARAAYPELRGGDQVLLNDPFAGGTHLNDLTVVAAVFDGTTLLGYVANRAHHTDVGGQAPGSIPAGATEIFQEGVRIPPVLLVREGDVDASILRLVLANSRTPGERRGDLLAQTGANQRGAARLRELAAEHTSAKLAEAQTALCDYAETRVRAALDDLPRGSWTFADELDDDGAGSGPVTIRCRITVHDAGVEVDLSGSDPQVNGSVNAVEAVTVSAACFVVRCLVPADIPVNAGCWRPLRVIAPAGTVVNANPPAAVGAGNVETSQRICDVIFGAFAQAIGDQVPAASQGTMNNVLIGGRDAAGAGFSYYETIAGGQGGAPWGPGQSGMHTGMTNTKNTPVEALERHYPMRVVRYGLRTGSGGAGQHPGGDGVERDLLVLEDATLSLITERRVSRPWGLRGGEPGATGENWLLPRGDETRAEPLPAKCTIRLRAGDVLRMLTPGGGGWGHPTDPASAGV